MTYKRRVLESSGIEPVIKHGYCVGCGVCAGLKDSEYEIVETKIGSLEARKSNNSVENYNSTSGRVCPFSDKSLNENQIISELFDDCHVHDELGKYLQTYAGYVLKGDFRQMGSSGGVGTWILEQLLTQGYVDGVVHVGLLENIDNGLMYDYKISRSLEDLRKGAKSKYYPVTLSKVIKEIRENPGRYVVIGVPCFIKAIRLLSMEDKELGKSVKFCVGLICGHMKSKGFAEFLSWQMGVHPCNLNSFDFRVKLDDCPANVYAVRAQGVVNGEKIVRTEKMQNLFGKDWGMGLFKLKACDYCDDVVAETADITVGDAWLSRYVNNKKGTNLIIVRNKVVDNIIRNGIESKVIYAKDINPNDVIKSQKGGYAHRRQGLAYRLWLADLQGYWRPYKRVSPKGGKYRKKFKQRHELRLQLSHMSHEAYIDAKNKNDINVFFDKILPIAKSYIKLTQSPLKQKTKSIIRLLKDFILKNG